METQVFLGLGSNLGDRQQYLQRAVELLSPKFQLKDTSSVYQTPPWGYESQPVYLNMVVSGFTGLDSGTLLTLLQKIESTLGRKSTFLYGPREIDLDILFYGSCVRQTQRLTIPHPQLHNRAFVLVPLAEIAPDFVHPILNKPVKTLLDALDETEVKQIKRYGL